MLYDKRWDRTETKPDVLSLEGLIAWLETQPANMEYPYACSHRCMLGQWLRSVDPKMELGPGDSYNYIVFGKSRDFRAVFQPVASRGDDRDGHTFGAALTRARAMVRS